MADKPEMRGKHAKHAKKPESANQVDKEAPSSSDSAAAGRLDASPHLADETDLYAWRPDDLASFAPDVPPANYGFDGMVPNRKRNAKKIAAIVGGSLFGVLIVAYVAGALAFSNWFPPNTFIGRIDASLKTSSEVEALIDKAVKSYRITVSGDGFSYSATAADTGLKMDSSSIVAAMHDHLNPLTWPYLLIRGVQEPHDETDKFTATYNASGLETSVEAAVSAFNETAVQPTDATIEYSTAQKAFVVKPESVGTALDSTKVAEAIRAALVSMEDSVKLTSNELLQPTVFSTDARLASAAEAASTMARADLKLSLNGIDAGRVNGAAIAPWVSLGDDYSVSLDKEALGAWIDELIAGFNTVGTERTYTRADGKEVVVSGGVYGWEVDADSLRTTISEGIEKGTVADVEIPCFSTGGAYTAPGERDWGKRYADVDLAEQHARFYDENGDLIWESDIVSGEPDGVHNTPTGVWWANAKASPSKLTGYEGNKKIYETEVRWWMPFQGNAVGFHDADWQAAFGGTRYADGFGSHGCVNLPPSKAQELYGIIQPGDCVVVHW